MCGSFNFCGQIITRNTFTTTKSRPAPCELNSVTCNSFTTKLPIRTYQECWTTKFHNVVVARCPSPETQLATIRIDQDTLGITSRTSDIALQTCTSILRASLFLQHPVIVNRANHHNASIAATTSSYLNRGDCPTRCKITIRTPLFLGSCDYMHMRLQLRI